MFLAIAVSTASLLSGIVVKNGETKLDTLSSRSESFMFAALGASVAAAATKLVDNKKRRNSDQDIDD